MDVLAKLVFEGYQIGTGYTGCIDDARANVENWEKLKSELIESQRSEIRLQGKIIELQSEQLKSVSTVVDTAIEKGMKSYSSVLQIQ